MAFITVPDPGRKSNALAPDAPQTKERGTILVRDYGMPSLTLDETIKGMERFFLDTARQADLLRSASYDDFLVYGNALCLLEAVRHWAGTFQAREESEMHHV